MYRWGAVSVGEFNVLGEMPLETYAEALGNALKNQWVLTNILEKGGLRPFLLHIKKYPLRYTNLPKVEKAPQELILGWAADLVLPAFLERKNCGPQMSAEQEKRISDISVIYTRDSIRSVKGALREYGIPLKEE